MWVCGLDVKRRKGKFEWQERGASELQLALFSRGLWGDGPHNFEPWSSDEEDTLAGSPSPNYRINGRKFQLSTDLMCIRPLHEVTFKLGIHQAAALDYIKRLGFASKPSFGYHTN
ncbi:hypothetical protein TNCV_2574131 [Trichonephila clavipes]|nr:hypothetical protein TNCV_2574131 [Trichonephila clavipes]